MTETYSDTVGSSDVNPYTVNGAITRDCPNCKAPAGARCTVEASGRLVGRRNRRCPCVARITSGERRR